jgi:hypothetical protein
MDEALYEELHEQQGYHLHEECHLSFSLHQ